MRVPSDKDAPADRHAPPSRPAAWYALRRTLPVWSVERNLQELIECLPAYGVDELIVKVDTEEFSHGHPTLEWAEAYLPHLQRIRSAMRDIGVTYSLNPWITVGHCDRGRDSRKQLPNLLTCVGHDGVQCTSCACPLCPVWRDHIIKLWTIYAQTRPRVLWIEDDIRTFNHAPVQYGCFCPEHMRRFGQRVNAQVSREGLVDVMLRGGEPHPWRKEYLDMQSEIMTETVAFLAKTVHQASPNTSMGLMSSGPRLHCLEGRRWSDFAHTLADGRTLYSRPPMGSYNETSLRGLYYSQDSIKLTRHVMPPDTVEQTEVENVPFTRYSKSINFTFLQMALSFACASHAVTMNLFDHAGTPMRQDPEMGQMLGRVKPFLNALAERARRPGRLRGVRILFDPHESYFKRLPARAPYDLLAADGTSLVSALESHGIATVYDDEPVAASIGQTLRAMDEQAIANLLTQGRGLLLDGVAANVLADRGFGKLIGIRKIQPCESIDHFPHKPFSAEEFFNPAFGGADKRFLTLTVPSLGGRASAARLEPAEGAQLVSRFVDPDAKRHAVCAYAYENRQGGRVFVHALDWESAFGPAFTHPFRAMQLQGAVDWLSGGQVPLLVRGNGAYPLALRRDCAAGILLGLFNLSLDPWPDVEFILGDCRPLHSFERLTETGQWVKDPDIRVSDRGGASRTVTLTRPIPFDHPLFLWAQ